MKIFIGVIAVLLCAKAFLTEALNIAPGQTRFAPGRYEVNKNTTFDQAVIFEEGAVLDIAAGVTVTFNGAFTAGTGQVFAGKGKVAGLQKLTPEWFGAKGDGTVDDTAALQKAINSFPPYAFWDAGPEKKSNVLLLRGTYLVTKLDVDTMYLDIIAENAWLVASPTGKYPYLIRFTKNFSSVSGLNIEGSYSLEYESMVHVNARHFRGHNIRIWRAKLAYRFGNPEWANRPSALKNIEHGDSENIFSNCSTMWCVRGIELYGSETIVTFNNSLIYSYPRSLPEGDSRKKAWEAEETTLIRSIGAYIYFTGSKLCNFNPRYPIVEVQPLKNNNRQYYSKYGGAFLFNCHMEGGNLFAAVNPKQIPTQSWKEVPVEQKTSSLTMISCGGYASGRSIPVNTDPLFTGSIIISNCNFYTDPLGGENYKLTTFARLGNPAARIKIDDISLTAYNKGLGAIIGGTPLFTDRLIFNAHQSAQMISTNATRLILTVPEESADTPHFAACYNQNTGEFTVPYGGLDNVKIAVGVHFADADWDDSCQVAILKNGEAVYIGRMGGGMGSIETTLAWLKPGDVLSVEARVKSGERQLDPKSLLNFFRITASRY
jgi:hypothetical protein